jgi:hypothetical protein
VGQVRDDLGRQLYKRQFDSSPAVPGTYRLHQGDLERTDKATAESYLAKMMRLVQEDSSIFSAFDQDFLVKLLGNLSSDLESIQRHLEGLNNAPVPERNYLVVEPYADSKHLDIDYWAVERRPFQQIVNAATPVFPYKQVSVAPRSARFKGPIFMGKAAPSPDDRMAALRYGLLTRNRIVSRQDVKQYVLHALAGYVEDVAVTNGVSISQHPGKGLVRTVDLLLYPSPTAGLTAASWSRLLLGLQENLNARSVHTAEYRLLLQPIDKNAN